MSLPLHFCYWHRLIKGIGSSAWESSMGEAPGNKLRSMMTGRACGILVHLQEKQKQSKYKQTEALYSDYL